MAVLSNTLRQELSEFLPEGWSFNLEVQSGKAGFDGSLKISPPAGKSGRFTLQLKARFEPRDIDQVDRLRKTLPVGERVLLVTPQLSSRSRQILRERNISYADQRGNIWLSNDSLLIDRTPLEQPPRRDPEQSPRSSLRGPITGRIVRFLCDMRPPLKVRGIATATDVNPGNVSRVLGFLEREKYVARDDGGSVTDVDWEALIKRWAQDLKKERHVGSFLQPRGIDKVTTLLIKNTLLYAVTGSYASAQLAPVVPPTAIDIYVQEIEEARKVLSLRMSENVGNVRLIQAFDRVAFERTLQHDGLVLAGPSQIAADLMTLPKRSGDEFSELVHWMKRNEHDWRH